MLFTILLATIVAATGVVATPTIQAATKIFHMLARDGHDTY